MQRISAHARLLAAKSHLTAVAALCAMALHPTVGRAETPVEVADARAKSKSAAATAIENVVVKAAKRKPVVRNSALGSRTLLETPFSISEVNLEQIKTLAAADINDAFSYDASAKLANSGVASGNTFRVRGLLLDRTNSYKLDGLPFPYWFQDFVPSTFESISLLKGVGGFLYGFASPGGILDFQSKEPTDSWKYSADVGVRSASIFQEQLDAGGPLTASGDTKVRVDLEQEAGYLYNNAYNEDYTATLALTGRFTPDISWSFNGYYLNTVQLSQVNTITLLATEGAITHLPTVNGKLDLGASGTKKTNSNPILTPEVSWQISPDWKATLSYRYSNLDERFPGNVAEIVNNAGEYVNIAFNINRYFEYNFAQFQLEGKETTGPLLHDIVAGATINNVIFDYFQPTAQVLGYGNILDYGTVPGTVGNANATAYEKQPVNYRLYQTLWENSLFLSDTVSYGPVSLLLGARLNDYQERDFSNVYEPQIGPVYTGAVYNNKLSGKVVGDYDLHPLSPSYALVVDVAPQTKAYASYAEALQASVQAPTTGVANPGAFLSPITSRQYEVGLKTAYGGVNGAVALFRIDQPVGLYEAPRPGSPLPVYEIGGNSRYQGVEVNAAVHPDEYLTITPSFAYLNATYLSGTTVLHSKIVPVAGEIIPGTSRLQASLLAEYRLPFLPQLRVNGGVRYIGDGYGDSLQLLKFPDATLFDIGASYELPVYGRTLKIRGRIDNLTDRQYWVFGQAQVSAGAPRTFNLNAEVDF
jgi:iron complex outermembrane receptor protein